MKNIICGYLNIKRKKYTFTLDDERKILLIQPLKLEKYPSFLTQWDFENHPYLKETIDAEGYTTNNRYIKFLNLNFKSVRWGCFESFVPAYIMGESSLIDPLPKPNKIFKMSFTGRAIDLLINPRKYVKDESIDFTNEMILKATNISNKAIKVSYRYKNNNYELKFSPNYKVTTIHKDVTRVLDTFSVLSIESQKPINKTHILDLYLLMERLLSFTNHRKRVDFDEVYLYQKEKIKSGDIIQDTTIRFRLIVSRPNEEISLSDKIENVLQIEEIVDHLPSILNNLLNDDFILLPFPSSNDDYHLVTNDKFLNVSASFECEIAAIHKDFRAEQNKNYKKAKDTIQSYIIKCINNMEYNSETRRSFQYFYDEIEKLDGSLQDKILHYLKKYKKTFEYEIGYLKNVKGMKDLKLLDIAKSFADRRNDMSHGNKIEKYSSILTVSYIIVMKLCYILFLQRSRFSSMEIDKIIDKIFK